MGLGLWCYYPFGLTMAGISSKAANALENKKKYNGIELDEDLGIEEYETFYRDLDPQTGRWWQIDPKCEGGADDNEQGLESLSPYNSMANDPIKLSDPLGDLPDWLNRATNAIVETTKNVGASLLGAVNAFTSNNIGGAGRVDGSKLSGTAGSSFRMGQQIGDVAGVITGGVEAIGGTLITALSGWGTAPVSVPVAIHGATTATISLNNVFSAQGKGRGKNNREPDPKANDDHSVINDKGSTTYKKNPQNPNGFDEVERIDTKGRPHQNSDGTVVPTPHKHQKGKKDVIPLDPAKDAMPKI